MPYGSVEYGGFVYGGNTVAATRTITYILNGQLLKQVTLSFTIDSSLLQGLSKTFTYDSALIKTNTKTFAFGSVLSKNVLTTLNLNTILSKSNLTLSFTIDANTTTFTFDTKFTIDAWTSYKEQIYQMQADIADLKANGGGISDVTVGTLYRSDGIKNW